MKAKNLIFIGIAALWSCNNMDQDLPMNQYITEEQKVDAKEANPERAQAAITGITGVFSSCMTVVDKHCDFGFPSIMMSADARGIDVVGLDLGYNWFAYSNELSDCTTNSYYTQMAWGHLYKQIFAANAAIKSLDPESEDPTIQFYMAQAHALRAFDYFMLAQIYQQPVNQDPTLPCVMLITEENEDEVAANGCLRSSSKDVYDLIQRDLNTAISLVEASGIAPEQVIAAKPKRFLSTAAIYGLRARVNLVIEKWADAASDAYNAIRSFNGAPLSFEAAAQPGFASIDDSNWMWGIAIATTDRVVTSGIVNWPSFMGSLNDGYASEGCWRMINKALFNSIPVSDARRGWWIDENQLSPNLTDAQQNWVFKKDMLPYTQVKFAPYQDVLGQGENANDIPLMRIEEMYLALAEAQAMSGDTDGGVQTLVNFIRQYRDPSYSFSSSSARDIQTEVLRQRRIELWGEGITYFDFMRQNRDLDRRGGGWEAQWCYDIPAGDPVRIIPIPNSEVQGNEMFRKSNTNNSASPIPTPVADID